MIFFLVLSIGSLFWLFRYYILYFYQKIHFPLLYEKKKLFLFYKIPSCSWFDSYDYFYIKKAIFLSYTRRKSLFCYFFIKEKNCITLLSFYIIFAFLFVFYKSFLICKQGLLFLIFLKVFAFRKKFLFLLVFQGKIAFFYTIIIIYLCSFFINQFFIICVSYESFKIIIWFYFYILFFILICLFLFSFI